VVNNNHGGGRPPLDLSVEDKKKRKKVLIRLSGLMKYYTPLLDFTTPPNELSPNALRRFNNFSLKYKELADQLIPLGGIPPRYQQVGIPQPVAKELASISAT